MRRFVRRVDDVLADLDERAAYGQIAQDAGVVANVGKRGRGLCQTDEIGVPSDLDQSRIGLHGRVQCERREHHSTALVTLQHRLIEALVQRIVELVGPEDRRDRFERAIIDQDRAEQRLLDFDVVGDVTIDFLFHGAASNGAAFLAHRSIRINRSVHLVARDHPGSCTGKSSRLALDFTLPVTLAPQRSPSTSR